MLCHCLSYLSKTTNTPTLNSGDRERVWILMFSEVTPFEYIVSTILLPIVDCIFVTLQVTRTREIWGLWHLQTADCRLHELKIEWNQKYRNKGGVIIIITMLQKVRPRSEVYIFHANYTNLIPKGAVGCSFGIELKQNNVCRCYKLAYESIATV